MAAPTPVTRIYLTGFMGAGKTTVGRILAQRLGWEFYDIDSLIEADQNAPVASLFSLHGEQAFRESTRLKGL
jgi:shikimate kinase